jgi:WD40 repeat protein
MRKFAGWSVFALLLAGLALCLCETLSPGPRAVIDDGAADTGRLSGDGSRLITTFETSKGVQHRIWNAHTGEEVGAFWIAGNRHVDSPGRRYRFLQEGQSAKIIDIQNAKVYAADTVETPTDGKHEFSPQGCYFWLFSIGWGLRSPPVHSVVDCRDGRSVRRFDDFFGIAPVGFTAKDDLLVWNPDREKYEIRRLPDFELVGECPMSRPVALSRNRRLALGRTQEGSWLIWDLVENARWPLRNAESELFTGNSAQGRRESTFFSPNGELVAIARDEEVCIWETASGRMRRSIPCKWTSDCRGGFTSNSRNIALVNADGDCSMFDTDSGQKHWTIRTDEKWVLEFHLFFHDSVAAWDAMDVKTGQWDRSRLHSVFGEYVLQHESPDHAGISKWFKRWLPATRQVRVLDFGAERLIHQVVVPEFERVELSENGECLVTRTTTEDGRRFFIWNLTDRPSPFIVFGIPLALGAIGVGAWWGWRRFRTDKGTPC